MAGGFAQWGNELYTGTRSYDIVGHRWRWYIVSIVLVGLSVLALGVRGINPGIEFRGGSLFTVSDTANVDHGPAADTVQQVSPEEVPTVTTVGDSTLRIETTELSSDQVNQLRSALAVAYDVDVSQVTTSFIGPSWGQDVTSKAVQGLVIFLVLVGVVMTLYFRSWPMAVAALLALAHDLIITVGIYAAIGWEVTPAGVIGFLTILGYSVYDTVVVFDKVRENTHGTLDQKRYTYVEQANLAVNQTLVRSINTSVVALLPVSAILFIGAFLLGAGTLRDISLALFVGMSVGTYSSIFLATPFEVTLRSRQPAVARHTASVLAARAAAVEAGGEGAPALVSAAPLRPGAHLGTAAQPRRRRTGPGGSRRR